MNILFLSLLKQPNTSQTDDMVRQSQEKDFQQALIEGIRANLDEGETISVIHIPSGLNLPYFGHKRRVQAIQRGIERWTEESSNNRMLLVYGFYLPYLQAVSAMLKQVFDLKACSIIPGLPETQGLNAGNAAKKCIWLTAEMNGLILHTKPLAVPLFVAHRKNCIIEGIVSDDEIIPKEIDLPDDERPSVLYTGKMDRSQGVESLLSAFSEMEAYQLWLCGDGDMAEEVKSAAKTNSNMQYFGTADPAQVKYLQLQSTLLINPRNSEDIETLYTFPAKMMDDMRIGKPLLCCKLEGIPAEYDEYLRYIEPQTVQGIHSAVDTVMEWTKEERDSFGRRAKEFILNEKNQVSQGKKALEFLRSL